MAAIWNAAILPSQYGDPRLRRVLRKKSMRGLFAVALLACGVPRVEPPSRFVVIDYRFIEPSTIALEAINLAAGVDWYHWTGQPRIGEEVTTVVATGDGWSEHGCGARSDYGDVYLCATMKPTWEHLPIVIIHELGHTRGLCHSKDRRSVMYRSTQATQRTVYEAAEEFIHLVRNGGNCE